MQDEADARRGDFVAPPVLDTEICYAPAECAHFNRMHAEYACRANGTQLLRNHWIIYALFGALFLYGAIRGLLSANAFQAAACVIVCAGIGYIVYMPRMALKRWQAQNRPFRLILDETGVRSTTDDFETRCGWPFMTFGWEDDTFMAFGKGTDGGLIHLLPRRAFNGDAAQEAAVRDLLSLRIPTWADYRTGKEN